MLSCKISLACEMHYFYAVTVDVCFLKVSVMILEYIIRDEEKPEFYIVISLFLWFSLQLGGNKHPGYRYELVDI